LPGTAYGTVVLHVVPKAATDGPLALMRNGDLITLDVAARGLHLHVSNQDLARRAPLSPPAPPA
jgi:dihydroxy-acid dehydratase